MKDKQRWSRKQGSKVVREWQRSGLSISAFARERKVESHRLRYWREKLEDEATESVESAEAPKLVPGVVVGLETSRVKVQLPRGVVVEASTTDEVQPAWLAELVVALENV